MENENIVMDLTLETIWEILYKYYEIYTSQSVGIEKRDGKIVFTLTEENGNEEILTEKDFIYIMNVYFRHKDFEIKDYEDLYVLSSENEPTSDIYGMKFYLKPVDKKTISQQKSIGVYPRKSIEYDD